jgi:hypothetical protein
MSLSPRFVLLSLVALAAASGCKPSQSQPSNVAPPPSQCPAGYVWNGAACVAQTTNPPPPPPDTPDAGTTTPIPTSNGGPSATPLDATAAAAASQALDLSAKQQAPGAKPVGGTLIAGQFQQGQTLEATFNAQPGKCYTVVGAGLPNVQNLDLQIVATVPLPGLGSPVLAVDQTTGPQAVVAPHPNCYKWALPMAAPLKVVMSVSSGSGIAAAQVYEK